MPVAPRAVLLINLGTPDELTVPSVRRFLGQFLSDPLVIRLPRSVRWFNPVLGWLIARFRARHALDMYRTIWTPEGSPIRTISQTQAARLAARLGPTWRVEWAMRYGSPSIEERLQTLRDEGIAELVVLPMFPQYSGSTSGSVIRQVGRWMVRAEPTFRWHVVSSWYDDRSYIAAQAAVIRSELDQRGWTPHDTLLLFSAHSIPLSHLRAGDPYERQVEASARGVAHELNWPEDRYRVVYQSRFGPVPWLGPATEEAAIEACRQGERRLLVCPLSFVADCLETLEELGVRLAEQVEAQDANMALCSALNATPAFIDALAGLARRSVAEPAGPTAAPASPPCETNRP